MSSAPAPSDADVANALRAGRIADARAMIADMPNANPMLVANVCARAGDSAGEIAALAGLLKAEPRHLPALLAMGEAQTRGGDLRAATSYFLAALGQAAVAPVPETLKPLLERARQRVADNEAQFADQLSARVPADVARAPRVKRALDLLLGREQLYLQQPSMFYFPGLPQRYFYEREEFEWVPELESKTAAMQAELDAALADHVDFDPYVATSDKRPPANNPLRDDPRWSSYFFYKDGAAVTEHAERCPQTMRALDHVPLVHVAGRSPMALWSLLRPGTHIAPHSGMLNTRLICHLPLRVPPGCGLRCGADTRAWEEGKLLIFDDSVEHEAWNRGEALRVVLLFEIWRPEVSAEEREGISDILSAIELSE